MSQGTKIGFTTAPGTPLSCQLERAEKEAMESVSLHQMFWQLIPVFHKFLTNVEKNARLKPVSTTAGTTGWFLLHSLSITAGSTSNHTGVRSKDYNQIDYSHTNTAA